MSTRDIVIAVFMIIGAIFCGLAGLNVGDGHYKDFIFFPLGVCSFFIGRILDRFWTAA